jgi:hypothetical protein
MTTIKITELTNIGANLASTTVFPVVNMSGTPTTEKTVLGNIANVILSGAGGNYVAVGAATVAATVTTNAQPNITSTGSLTGLTVSNATGTVNFSNTANVTLGAVGNLHIAGGTAGQLLSTNGNGTLSWTTDANSSYGNTNVANYLPTFTGNVGAGNVIATGNLYSAGLLSNGVANINSNVVSTNPNTGALQVRGGLGVLGNIHSNNEIHSFGNIIVGGHSLFVGAGADAIGFNNSTLVAFHGGNDYVQAVLKNSTDSGSADWVAYGDNGTESQGWADFGFTSSAFDDANYTITGAGDGYFFVNTFAGSYGGNLVIATGTDGTVKDIIFATGGFAIANEFARFDHSANFFHLTRTGSGIKFADGTTQTTAAGGLPLANGNSNFNIATANGNATVTVAGTQAWTFGTDGNLILAGGNSVIQSIANSSSEPLYPNVSTMVFTPDAFLSSQSLVLDPTGPSHIHLRAPGANIDEPDANIFLGGEASSFEVGYYNGNVPNLYIHSNNNTWTFDNAGNLTLPLGSIVYETNIPDGALSGSAIALKPIGGTTANQQLLIYPTAADGDHIHMTSGNLYATELFLGSDNLYVKLANTGNVVINSNDGNSSNAMWTFDTDGNLTLPGNLVINGLTNVFGSNVALLQSNPDLPLLSISSGSNGGVSSLWVEDIGNVGTSNIAAVYANPTSGSGIVRIAVGQNGGNAGPNLWDFNANGTTTLPGNLISSGASPAPSISGFDSISSISVSASGNISANNFTGNGGGLSNVATKISSSWTLASGNNTVSISVPLNGTYAIWVNGNIPNGIVTYTATAVVTNTNVPVLGEQYAWYYAVGNALVFTTIPDQFTGTVGSISNVNTYIGNTANVFTFGITNNSGANAVVNYGYTKL